MVESRISIEDFARLKALRCKKDPRYGNICNRLRELFWDDSCNDLNLKLYQRLEREAIVHGEVVYNAIKSVAASARSKDNPIRYFAASITRRLNEMGYLESGEEDLGL